VSIDSIIKDRLDKLNKKCVFEELNVKLDIKLNIEVRQEYHGMKCNNKYYIFNIYEWEEKGYYKIMYLIAFNEDELHKINEIYKEIAKNPSEFFDNLYDKFNNGYAYKDEIVYNLPFLALSRKNKPNYEYIIIINIKNKKIYIPNVYKFLSKKISMEISSYISEDPNISTIIKIYKKGKFLVDFLVFYDDNDKENKYKILEYVDEETITSENILYNKSELGKEIIERIRQWL